jgi:hypothetical protein
MHHHPQQRVVRNRLFVVDDDDNEDEQMFGQTTTMDSPVTPAVQNVPDRSLQAASDSSDTSAGASGRKMRRKRPRYPRVATSFTWKGGAAADTLGERQQDTDGTIYLQLEEVEVDSSL